MKRTYQRGTIERRKRAGGPDVWVLRWRETMLDGDRQRRSEIFADVIECPTLALAELRADEMRARINRGQPVVLFRSLAERYLREELPERAGYESKIKRLQMRWDNVRLDWMATHPKDIELWLKAQQTMEREQKPVKTKRRKGWVAPAPFVPRPLNKKTLENIRGVLHRMFECGMAWQYLDLQRNPIELVELTRLPRAQRQRHRRVVLDMDSYQELLADPQLSYHVKVIMQVAMMTGMGISEILGLQWGDIDFDLGWIQVQRSVVGNKEGDTKTEYREAEVPMQSALAGVLIEWREQRPGVGDWLFGSALTGRPFWGNNLRKDHLQPAGRRLGIEDLGWHTFRHTYRSLLRELETEDEVQQALMRHASIAQSREYGKSSPAHRRKLLAANAKLVEFVTKREVR